MSWTEVKVARVLTTGSIGSPPLRIRGIYVATSVAKGTVSIQDGTDATLLFDTISSTATHILIPTAGVRFAANCSITAPAGTALTIFYD